MKLLPNSGTSELIPSLFRVNVFSIGWAEKTFFLFYRFFTYGEETREERRLKQAQLRAYGKEQAMLRKNKLESNAENSSGTSE